MVAMTDEAMPRTEAGRALLNDLAYGLPLAQRRRHYADAILAIEDAMPRVLDDVAKERERQDAKRALEAKAWWEDAHGEVVLLSDATDALEAALSAPAGLDVERAARDVDGLWEAGDGEPIRFLPEFAEALEDLRAALAASKP